MRQAQFTVTEQFKTQSELERKKAVCQKIDLHIKNKLKTTKNQKPVLEKDTLIL